MKEWKNFSTCGVDALDLKKNKKLKMLNNHRRIRDANEKYYGITMITCYIAEWIQITLK